MKTTIKKNSILGKTPTILRPGGVTFAPKTQPLLMLPKILKVLVSVGL